MRPVLSLTLLLSCTAPSTGPGLETDADTDADADTDTDADTDADADTAMGCMPDAWEDNDAFATAVPLPDDAPLTSEGDDDDFWTVDVEPWSAFTLTVSHDPARGDIDVLLLDAEEGVLDAATTGFADEIVRWANYGAEPATVIARVRFWEGLFTQPSCAPYTVATEQIPLPSCPPDTLESDDPIALGGPFSGLNVHPNAPDTFTLDAVIGDRIQVRIDEAPGQTGALEARLVGPDGTVVAEDALGPDHVLDHLVLDGPGTHTVELVANACLAYAIEGDVLVNPGCRTDVAEPNDGVSAAHPLVDGRLDGLNGGPSAPDWFSIPFTAGMQVELEAVAEGTFGLPELVLTTGDGLTELGHDDGADGRVRIVWTDTTGTDGTLAVRVESPVCQDYGLDLARFAPPDCSQPDAAEPNDLDAVALADLTELTVEAGDTDRFEVVVPGASALTVLLPTDRRFGNPVIGLEDVSGLRLALDPTGPDWGVRAHNASSEPVTWTVDVSATTCTAYGLRSTLLGCTSDDPQEPNDTLTSALPLTATSDLQVRDGSDDHWSLGTVLPGEQLSVHAHFAQIGGDLDLELLAADGTLLADAQSVTDDELVRWTNPTTGPLDVVLRVLHWPTPGATCRNNRYSLDVDLQAP